jgi:hypothetical protein
MKFIKRTISYFLGTVIILSSFPVSAAEFWIKCPETDTLNAIDWYWFPASDRIDVDNDELKLVAIDETSVSLRTMAGYTIVIRGGNYYSGGKIFRDKCVLKIISTETTINASKDTIEDLRNKILDLERRVKGLERR